jgi:hypothetical protein
VVLERSHDESHACTLRPERDTTENKQDPVDSSADFTQVLLAACLFLNPTGGSNVFLREVGLFEPRL